MSYNLRSLRDDRAAAAAVIRAVAPDVLLVQEAPRHPGAAARIRGFARECGLTWGGRTRWVSGTTVLTRAGVAAGPTRDHALATQARWGRAANPRGFSTVRVRGDRGAEMIAVCVHLSLVPAERELHALQIVHRVRAAAAGTPVVLGGDLNESQEAAAWQVLQSWLPQVSEPAPTFPARHPRACIDAIFADARLPVGSGAEPVLSTSLLEAASDHRPIWVDLDLTRGV